MNNVLTTVAALFWLMCNTLFPPILIDFFVLRVHDSDVGQSLNFICWLRKWWHPGVYFSYYVCLFEERIDTEGLGPNNEIQRFLQEWVAKKE